VLYIHICTLVKNILSKKTGQGRVGGLFGAVDDDTHTSVRHHGVGNALAIRTKAQGASAKRRIGFVRLAIYDEKTLLVLLDAISQTFTIWTKAQRAAQDGNLPGSSACSPARGLPERLPCSRAAGGEGG
jgi:hypothetical protein